MKVQLTFKCPDVLDQVTDEVSDAMTEPTEEVDEEIALNQRDGLKEMLRKWVKFDECVTLEFDTDTGTVEVLPVDR